MGKTTAIMASFLALILCLAASTASAAGNAKELTLQLEGADGDNISLSISADFVDDLVAGLAGADLHCDVTTDKDTRAMLEHLDRRGEGSRYRFRDEDGQLVKASRSRGQLELDIAKSGERDAHISLPWTLAECMLGRRVALAKNARVRLDIEDEGAIRIRVE